MHTSYFCQSCYCCNAEINLRTLKLLVLNSIKGWLQPIGALVLDIQRGAGAPGAPRGSYAYGYCVPVKDLENDPLVIGKLGDDVSQEEVAVVLGGWIHALLGEEAGPGKGHQAMQLGPLVLVVGVVDVRNHMLHQQG